MTQPLLDPGMLDKRVVIKTPIAATASQNGYGEPTGTPATLATRWAFIETLNGSEVFHGLQVIAKATHKVRMRYLVGVTPGCILTYAGRTLYVGLVDDENTNGWAMTLICGEKVAT